MLYIYDGLNVIRRRIDKDPMGRAPRNIVTEMLVCLPDNVHVWTFEGKQHLSRRREIYPSYKDRPSTAPDGFFQLVGLIRGALRNTKAIQIDVPGYEADDVIAHLVCEHAGKTDICIETTDRDLNQLLVLPRVTSTANPIKGVEPQFVRLYKTYVGDGSDKIPGLRGFGDRTWERTDKVKLLKAHLDPSFEAFLDAGLPERLAAKAIDQRSEIEAFWKVVGFLDLDEGYTKYIQTGIPNPSAADAILREFGH